MTRGAATASAIVVAMVLPSGPIRSQLRPEARVEYAATSTRRVELGVGLFGSIGGYVRHGVGVARDSWSRNAAGAGEWRAEYVARFTMDPLAEQRWALSLGGGLGLRERAYVLAVADVEGPRMSGVRPAVQLTLGGGLRVGIVLRRAVPGRR